MRMIWDKWLIWIVVQFIVWQLVFKIDSFVNFWVDYVICYYHNFIQFFTNILSRGIGEIFYILFALFFLFTISYSLKKRSFKSVYKFLFLILFMYNSVWGIIYYRQNFDVPANQEIKIELLKELYYYSLNEAITNRQAFLHDDQPMEIPFTISDYLKEFKQNQKLLANEKWVLNHSVLKNPSVVHSRFINVLNYSGVLGYYNPFVTESNINSSISDLKIGATIFHELAHQMGYASESEANFIAYYIGNASKKPEIKYFTNYKLMFYVLNLIGFTDPVFAKNELEQVPLAILEDRKAEIEFYSKYDGKVNDSFSFMNNQFLKMNNQEGVISYSKYIELVYFYHFNIKKASKN